jgi:hypothetical protein
MVQDLKRGGSFRGGAEGRRKSVLGIEDEVGEPLLRRRTEESSERVSGRGRSFSGTLGGLLRGLSGRGSRESIADDGRQDER